MRSIWMRMGLVPLLATALWVTGCSEQAGPLQPEIQGPSASLSLEDDLAAIMKGEVPELNARTVSKVIGPDGGYLYADLHYLHVPKHAVKSATLFEMRLTEDGTIGADLTATSLGSQVPNNVGKAGFRVPVYLTFSYAYATNPPSDPNLLKVVWARPDGTYEVQPTYVDKRYRIATGVLKHFSDYLLAMP